MKARTKRAKPQKTPRLVYCENCKWFSASDESFSAAGYGPAGLCCNPRSHHFMHNILRPRSTCVHSRPYPLFRRVILSLKQRKAK